MVPKSSITILTPSRRRRLSLPNASSVSVDEQALGDLKLKSLGRKPRFAQHMGDGQGQSAPRNCAGERLIATVKGLFQVTASLQARRSTHSPSGTIKPVSSATEMKRV